MDLETKKEDFGSHASRLLLQGSVDSWTSEEFRNQTLAMIDQGIHKLLLDMEHVKYISSQGIGALFEIMKKMKSVDGYFAIFEPHLAVRRALEIVKMENSIASTERMDPDNPFYELIKQREEQAEAEKEQAVQQKQPQA